MASLTKTPKTPGSSTKKIEQSAPSSTGRKSAAPGASAPDGKSSVEPLLPQEKQHLSECPRGKCAECERIRKKTPSGRAKIQAQRDQASRAVQHRGPKRQPDGAYLYPPEEMTTGRYHYVAKMRPSDPLSRWFSQIGAFQRCDESVLQIDGTNTRLIDGRKMSTTSGRLAAAPGKWLREHGASPFWTGLVVEYFESRLPEVIERYRATEARKQAERLRLLEEDLTGWGVSNDEAEIFLTLEERAFLQETRAAAKAKFEAAKKSSRFADELPVATCAERPAGYDAVYEFVGPLELDSDVPAQEDFDSWQPVRGDYLWNENDAEAVGCRNWALAVAEQFALADEFDSHVDTSAAWRAARSLFRRARIVARTHILLDRILQDVRLDRRADKAAYPFLTWFFRKWATPPEPRPSSARLANRYRDDLVRFVRNSLARPDCPKKDQYFWLMPILHRRWNWLRATGQHRRLQAERQFKVWYITAAARSFDYKTALRSGAPVKKETTVTKRPKVASILLEAQKEVVCECHDYVEKERKRMGGRIPSAAYDNVKRRYYALKAKCPACRRPRRSDRKNANREKHASNGNIARRGLIRLIRTDGWCYLRLFPAAEMLSVASYLGPYPLAGDVAYLLGTETIEVSSISTATSSCFHVGCGPRVPLPVRAFRPWWLTPVGGTPTMASLDAEVRRLRMLYEGAVAALTEAQAEVRALKAAPHRHCAIDFDFVDFEVTPPAPTEDCPPEMAECIRHASEHSRLHSFEDCREDCGHTHDDFVDREACRQNCHHVHDDFSDFAACTQHLMREGVRDLSNSYVAVSEEPVVLPVSTSSEQFSYLVPPSVQEPDDGSIPSGQMMLNELIRALNGKHVVPAKTEEYIKQQSGLYLYEARTLTEGSRNRAVEVRRVAKLNIHVTRHDSLCLAPDAWVSGIRNAALAVLIKERFSGSHMPGIECSKTCPHHKGSPSEYPARKRRECKQFCGHEPLDFPEYVNLREKNKALREEVETLHKAGTTMEAEIARLTQEQQSPPRVFDWRALPEVQDLILAHRRELDSLTSSQRVQPAKALPDLTSRVNATKASLHAWHNESFKGPRDQHSRRAMAHLSTCAVDALPTARLLPPPTRVFKPQILSRWWNNVNTSIEISGKTFSFHAAGRKFQYQDDTQLLTFDPASRAAIRTKSWVANWNLLEYAYDRLKGREAQPEFLNALMITEDVLRHRARNARPYDMMTRRTYMRKWDRATTKPSDPGPWQDLAAEFGYEMDATWTWTADSYDASHVHRRMTKRQFLALWPNAEILPPGTTVDLDYEVDGVGVVYPVEFRLAPGLYLEPGPEVYVCHEKGFASWDRVFPCDMFMPHPSWAAAPLAPCMTPNFGGVFIPQGQTPLQAAPFAYDCVSRCMFGNFNNGQVKTASFRRFVAGKPTFCEHPTDRNIGGWCIECNARHFPYSPERRCLTVPERWYFWALRHVESLSVAFNPEPKGIPHPYMIEDSPLFVSQPLEHGLRYRTGPYFTKARWRIIGPVLAAHPDEPYGRDPSSRNLHQVSDDCLMGWKTGGFHPRLLDCLNYVQGLELDGQVWVTAAMKPLTLVLPTGYTAVINFGVEAVTANVPVHHCPVNGRLAATARLVTLASRHSGVLFSIRNGRGHGEEISAEELELIPIMYQLYSLFSLSWLSENIPVGAGTIHGTGGTIPWSLFGGAGKWAQTYGYDELLLNDLGIPTYMLKHRQDPYYGAYHVHFRPNIVGIEDSPSWELDRQLSETEAATLAAVGKSVGKQWQSLVEMRQDVARSRTTSARHEACLLRNIRNKPWAPLALSHRSEELTCFRFAGAPGLHHTLFLRGRLAPPPRLLHCIQRLRPLVDGKRVVVTASAASPPQRLRDVHINFGTPHPDWINFPVPTVTGSGREFALWRLLPLFCQPKEVWIVNGRDLVEQPLPPLEKGRFCSWNRHNCNPIILATTRTDVQLDNLDEFWHTMVYYGDTYGSDEWFLKDQPLTVFRPRIHTDADWRTIPAEEEWPNVRIFERRRLIHDGPFGRVSRLSSKPPCLTLGTRLSLRDRPSLSAASGASDQQIRYLHAPTELTPQERSETVLIVCHGSRGDHVPLEYIARVIQTQGIKVVLWSAHFLSEEGYEALRNGRAGETLFAWLALMGAHHLGFRLVLTPGPKLHHRSCRYSLTNWANTEMPAWAGNPLAAVASRMLSLTAQSLVIGCTPGTNTPRSADGLHRLTFRHPTAKRAPAAWVESSGSKGHIPRAIQEQYPGIRIPYDPSVFSEYETIYTTGTQGTVDTILAYGATPVVVDAWFDQERTCVLTPAQFQENSFAALGHALTLAGLTHGLGGPSWSTLMYRALGKVSWSSGLKWLSLFVVLLQYVTVLAPWLATFPGLATLAPAHVPLFWAISKTLWNYPLLYYFWRWKWLVSILAAWIAFDQLTLWCLGAASSTYMHVETSSKWPFFLHATIIDVRTRRKIEYGWYGPRSLLAPFVGRVWNKLDHEETTGIRIPILIDFDAAAAEASTNAGKYGPFFNCQSVWLTRLGNNYPVLTLFLLVQGYVVSLVFFPWFFVMAFYWLDIKFWGRHWAEQVTMGPRSEDAANIVMGTTFEDDDEDEDTCAPSGLEKEEPEETSEEEKAFEELTDEEQALAAIRFVITEMPEDEVVPDGFITSNATALLRQAYDVQDEELLREEYSPVQGDTIAQWVEDFTTWCFEEIRAAAASAPLIKDIVRFVLACKDSLYKTADPLLSALRASFPALKAFTTQAVSALVRLCSRLVDLVFGRQVTRKLKAAWFGAELLRPNKLSLQQQVRENLAKAHFFMEPDFDAQYAKDVGELRAAYREEDVDWDRLKRLQRDDFKQPSRYQHRGQRGFGGPIWKPLPLPRSLVLSQQELDVLMEEAQKEGVDFNARVDEFFTRRVDRLMAGGTPLATDGALLAAIRPRQAESSLLRYTYHGIDPNTALRTNTQPLSPELKHRLHAVGDALYESCPEMFDNPRLTPPEAMTEWWKHRGMTKYNTTAPLNMASRAHAIADGQIAAIVRNVYEKEKAGEYPNQYYGAKVKQQAVPVRPLVTPNAKGELKPVRTFTAQDSRSTAADWTVGLELKNRLPGDHVGVSSKMAAGQGYSPLFRKIMGKANIFEGDMGRYDSQLEAMHFEMIDRVLSRGCSDEVVLSWLTAKHQAMQNAYIAVLSLPREKPLADFLQHARASQPGASRAATGYENWILKIRSGATGESSTNWTDTYTFRATFCLIVWDYCDHFGIPFHPKDFFNDALANLTNSGDDNMGHLDFLKKYDHVLDPEIMIACARKNNMILDFAVLDSFDKCEFLGCMARLPTKADLHTLERVRSLLAAVNEAQPGVQRRADLVKYAAINPTLVDPVTMEEPDIIVYRNLSNSLVRQTATTLHGNVFKDDKYLEGWIAKYAGHIQLCAFRPTYHQDTMLEYIQTAARYLYAATPSPRRNQQGIVLMPEGEDYDRILDLLNLQYEDVNRKMVYAAPKAKAPAGSFYTPELRRRLLKISQQPPAAYSKVIAIHMAYGKKPASYYERKMNKILSGLYPIDEAAKEFLDVMRSAIGEASRKLIKGFQPQARDQMYLEDIYDTGHYYVESAIWTTWEEKIMEEESKLHPDSEPARPEMTLPIWQGLCSKAAFGSITDPLRYYALMQDAEFNAHVHERPAYVYRNLMWCLVLFYAALWRLEVFLYKLPVIGFLYALFMFMVMDMSKVYGLVSMVYWLEYMDVHPVISSWMPRDPYVLAKRLSSWQLKLIPLSVAAVLPFSLTGGLVGQFCVWFGQFFNRMQALKPLAGHGTPIDNPWTGDAHRMLDLLDRPDKTPDHAIVLNSETGTGKSALGTDALHRLIRHQVNPRSRMWVFVPTRILLKDPMPGFLGRGVDSDPEHSKTYQVLRRGVPIRANAEILFMTYGHGRNRLLAGEFQRGVDTAFVDEMHILSAEQRLVCDDLHGERIIFSSATHIPPPGFTAPVFRSSQKKKWKAYQRVFPATTNVASMYQRARNDTEPVMGMRHSPAELSERALILCATFKEIDELVESLVTLRKSVYGAGIGVSLPPVVEVSSRIKPGTTEWAVRQAAFEKGSYIAVGTKQAATGMDIKPNPPWLLVDGGEDIYSHEGSIVRLPTTPRDHEQRIGRVTRNSSDRDGLVYCRQQAGSRDWDTMEYPSVSYCSEKLISDAYRLPMLLPVDNPAVEAWPYFQIAGGYESHVHDALMFFVLASCSGVQPRALPDFYLRHWQHQIPLSEDYEWMDTLLRRQGRQTTVCAPAWVTVEAVLAQKPIGWNTTGVRAPRRAEKSSLAWSNALYPVAGEYLSFEEASRSTVRRLDRYTSVENRAENIAADIIDQQQSVIDKLLRRVNDLELGRETPSRKKLTPSEVLTLQARERLSDMIKSKAKGVVVPPGPLAQLASRILSDFTVRERAPEGSYTGVDISSALAPNQGWGYCSDHGCPLVVEGSGPDWNDESRPACGCRAAARGDHAIAEKFVVVKRGTQWISKYALDDIAVKRCLASLDEKDVEEATKYVTTEITKEQKRTRKIKAKNTTKSDDRGAGRDVNSSRRHTSD